jgi:hypothetical protein
MHWMRYLVVLLFVVSSPVLQAQSPGTVQFSSAAYSVNESGAFATITLTRTGGSSGPASVEVLVNDGTATVVADYSVPPTCAGPPCPPVEWPDGDATPKTIQIRIVDDALDEPAETVLLSLVDPQGATIGSPGTAVLTILNDDSAVVPTLGESAQLLLMALLAASGAWILRRRRLGS